MHAASEVVESSLYDIINVIKVNFLYNRDGRKSCALTIWRYCFDEEVVIKTQHCAFCHTFIDNYAEIHP